LWHLSSQYFINLKGRILNSSNTQLFSHSMSKKDITRRKFISTASTAAAGFFIVPRHVLGRGFVPPSDKLNVAFIGAGGQAATHIERIKGKENIVAFADVDDNRAAGAYKEFPNVPRYKDFRKMLDAQSKNIDAVMIAIPDHMHAAAAIPCMELGKHVYVEKPLTHDIAEAREMLKVAQRTKVVTQMGNQGASMDCNREIAEWIQSGVIGDVTKAHVWTNRPVWPQGVATPTAPETVPDTLDWNLWLGNAKYRPYSAKYMPFKWRGWWEFGTGALGDMGAHLLDPAYRALKLTAPTTVEANATTVWSGDFVEANYPDSCPPSSYVKMQFPARDKMVAVDLFWYDGGIRPMRPEELGPNEPFGSWDGGVLFEGTKGKILCGIYGENATLLPASKMKDFKAPTPWLKRLGDINHQTVWAQACKGIGEATSPFEYAVPLTETLLIANLAIRAYDYKTLKPGKTPTSWAPYDYNGRIRMEWDATNLKMSNYNDANQFIKRDYRTGW
jgi:predicted dehydrogenase